MVLSSCNVEKIYKESISSFPHRDIFVLSDVIDHFAYKLDPAMARQLCIENQLSPELDDIEADHVIDKLKKNK